jgi:hypothetical protein
MWTFSLILKQINYEMDTLIGLNNLKRNNMEELYDYVFHYNPYTGIWNAIPREDYTEYWNNSSLSSVIKSKNLNTLIELVTRGEGFIKTIK